MNFKKIFKTLFMILFPLISAYIISLFINFNNYSLLYKPPLAPPKIVFPIIWSILYILMGVSYLIINYDKSEKKIQFLYYIHLFFNLLWPILFFNLNLYLTSSLLILLLISLHINLLHEYSKIKKEIFFLNIPYLVWLIFAFYLALGVFILN